MTHPAAPNFRADGIDCPRLAGYPGMAGRSERGQPGEMKGNAAVPLMIAAGIRCGKSQPWPYYAAGYAGLSTFSWADKHLRSRL
jgi:hypothetical protein